MWFECSSASIASVGTAGVGFLSILATCAVHSKIILSLVTWMVSSKFPLHIKATVAATKSETSLWMRTGIQLDVCA